MYLFSKMVWIYSLIITKVIWIRPQCLCYYSMTFVYCFSFSWLKIPWFFHTKFYLIDAFDNSLILIILAIHVFKQVVLMYCGCFIGFVTRVTRRVSLVENELLALPKHLSSPPLFSGVCVAWTLAVCVMFCRSLFVLFHLAIVLSVLRFTDFDYPFGIFKLFKPPTVVITLYYWFNWANFNLCILQVLTHDN